MKISDNFSLTKKMKKKIIEKNDLIIAGHNCDDENVFLLFELILSSFHVSRLFRNTC